MSALTEIPPGEKALRIPLRSFHYIRHGETAWNRERRFMGHTDIPLNEYGVAQAHAAATHLRDLGIQRIVHTPLTHATQTAEIISSYGLFARLWMNSIKG